MYSDEIDRVGFLRSRDCQYAVLERTGDGHHLASFERFELKRTATAA